MTFKTLHAYTKDLHLLYVEDEKELAIQTVELLEMFFKSVTVCKDGIHGLDTYKEHTKLDKNSFDIVLTDLNMPKMNGLEMIENILSINPKQNISVISALEDVPTLLKLINLGIDGFLFKPLQEKQLIQTLYKISYNINNEKISLHYQVDMAKSNAYLEKEVKKQTKKIQDQLYTDHLTKLKNRIALNRDIKENRYTMLALIDIDQLEFINNLYGTDIGNHVIKRFANLLQLKLSSTNYSLYHTSGDEFAICSNDNGYEEFEKYIKEISAKVTNLVLYIEEISDEINIDATIGVTYELNILADLDISYESHLLLAQANTALKYAKVNKIELVYYNESINRLQDIQNIMQWKQKIKIAYENDNIVPVFQPIVNNRGEVLKYETLMRLREVENNKTNLISPYYFLDTAILTKQYAKLSESIIKQALESLIVTEHTLSINIRYNDIQNPRIIELLESTLESNAIGDRLIVEIVESEDIKDYKLLRQFINQFRKYGVMIAIDDFGSGFSNFKNIIEFKPDYLKIDGSLVKEIDYNISSLAIVTAIIEFAHTLNIKVIAEYVHSKEVLEVLKKLKVDEYQGFYFYEPSLEFIKEEIVV